MSTESLQIKKDTVEAYFECHPDSRTIEIVGSGQTFPALFDHAHFSNNRDAGRITQQKRVPHLTFFSDYESLLEPRVTQLTVDGTTYTVNKTQSDKTEETFQAEVWLV